VLVLLRLLLLLKLLLKLQLLLQQLLLPLLLLDLLLSNFARPVILCMTLDASFCCPDTRYNDNFYTFHFPDARQSLEMFFRSKYLYKLSLFGIEFHIVGGEIVFSDTRGGFWETEGVLAFEGALQPCREHCNLKGH
jgi:hypothetical protein